MELYEKINEINGFKNINKESKEMTNEDIIENQIDIAKLKREIRSNIRWLILFCIATVLSLSMCVFSLYTLIKNPGFGNVIWLLVVVALSIGLSIIVTDIIEEIKSKKYRIETYENIIKIMTETSLNDVIENTEGDITKLIIKSVLCYHELIYDHDKDLIKTLSKHNLHTTKAGYSNITLDFDALGVTIAFDDNAELSESLRLSITDNIDGYMVSIEIKNIDDNSRYPIKCNIKISPTTDLSIKHHDRYNLSERLNPFSLSYYSEDLEERLDDIFIKIDTDINKVANKEQVETTLKNKYKNM